MKHRRSCNTKKTRKETERESSTSWRIYVYLRVTTVKTVYVPLTGVKRHRKKSTFDLCQKAPKERQVKKRIEGEDHNTRDRQSWRDLVRWCSRKWEMAAPVPSTLEQPLSASASTQHLRSLRVPGGIMNILFFETNLQFIDPAERHTAGSHRFPATISKTDSCVRFGLLSRQFRC
jgi:hypothetical protein